MCLGTVADWIVAVGTLVVATVAVFQETIRGWFYRPVFQTLLKNEPPDCIAIPITTPDGTFLANSVYLRLWVENIGNATARNAEVDAKELRRKRLDGRWERVSAFPPMNLKWANVGKVYLNIAPGMGRHCDIGHIADPAPRHQLEGEEAPGLGLTNQQTSLTFDLMVRPNNRTHIIGPGEYQLDIRVAAENVRPIKRTVAISLQGAWDGDETRMLRDGVGISILADAH